MNSKRLDTKNPNGCTAPGSSRRKTMFTRPSAAAALLIMLAAALFAPPSADGWVIKYKEQFFRLFRVHYHQSVDSVLENIFWLEQALSAPFANPLYAIARIETEIQFEKYRYLFMMQLNIKMVEQYIALANQFNKRNALFFNAPWRDQNLRSLDIAETYFEAARHYWEEAVRWAHLAREPRFRFVRLERVEFWKTQAFRIVEQQSLNYGRTLDRELASLRRVREQFEAMEWPP